MTEVSIRYLGPKGDGVADGPRGRIFVEGGLPGDRVRVRTWRDEEGIVRGEVVGLLQPSRHRRQAPCPHYDVCGGCTLQHADDGFYRNWKLDLVSETLKKNGLTPRKWETPVFIEGGSRRRATFAAYRKRDRVVMGYFRRRSKDVADISACLVADPALFELRDALRPHLAKILQEGKMADVFLQRVGNNFDMVITGRVGTKGEPDLAVREAVAELVRKTKVSRVGWRARGRDAVDIIIEREPLLADFGALSVPLPPAAFLQPTLEGEQALVQAVMGLLPAKGHFADLFSGCGTFTGPMLARGSVDAFESVEPAIKALTRARGALPLKAVKRDLFKSPLRREDLSRYDAVVFDPPRAGAKEQCAAMATAKVPLLVGVSCNPSSFARDARILCDGGYRLDTVRVVDQFTWSHHVELVASFTRK